MIPYRMNPLGLKLGGGNMPNKGLIFYDPLDKEIPVGGKIKSGQLLYRFGGASVTQPTVETFKGIKCTLFTSTTAMFHADNMPVQGNPVTMSIWYCSKYTGYSYNSPILCYWKEGVSVPRLAINDTLNPSFGEAGENHLSVALQADRWYFLALTYSNGIGCFYIDGENIYEQPHTVNIAPGEVLIQYGEYQPGRAGRLASPRIYNRLLSASEIAALAKEHNPTA